LLALLRRPGDTILHLTVAVPIGAMTVARRKGTGMRSKVNLGLVIANCAGIAVYLYWCSRWAWYIPAEREAGIDATTAEPFLWAAIVVMVGGPFLVIDLIWGLTIIIKKRWRSAPFWFAVLCMWLVSVVIDFAHH
jgi:hypothetical protein